MSFRRLSMLTNLVGSALHRRPVLLQATSKLPAYASSVPGSDASKPASSEAVPTISDIKHRNTPFSTPLSSPTKGSHRKASRLEDPKTPLSNRPHQVAIQRSFPNSPTKRSTSRVHSFVKSDHLAMLDADVEYVPLSPQKKQVAALGVGRPTLSSSVEGSGTSDTGPSARRLSPAAAPSAGTPSAKRIPRRVTLTLGADDCRRKTSFPERRLSVFDTRQQSSPLPNHSRERTAEAQALRRTPSQTPGLFDKPNKFSPTKSGFTSPTKSLSPGKSKTSSPTKSIIHDGHTGTRSTEEKKALLSNWLGNVDALVEGVQRAGVWGLE